MLALAAPNDPLGQRHRIQQGVVPVEYRQAIFLQMRKNLAFRLQDSLPAAQILNMSVTNVGDHGDIRAHHGTQILDLSEMVHSRFDHRRLMLRGKTQQRQRRSNVIVEILRRFQNVQLRPQYRGDHLFRGSFSHAAGDLHKGNLEPIPVSGRQIPQGKPGVRHLDIKFVRADILGKLGAQAACRAGIQRRVDKLVAVELLPHPGQEQAAGGDFPAVRGNGADRRDLIAGIPPDALDCGYDLC